MISPMQLQWLFFRERIRKANVIDELFEMFESYLRDQGLEASGGQIIHATLLQQKDLDARWIKKMISITMVIKIVFALMLSMVLSYVLSLPLQIFMMIMYGQILHILASNLKIYLA